MQLHRQIFHRASSQPGLDHQIEAGVFERGPRGKIIGPTKRHPGIVLLQGNVSGEATFDQPRPKAPCIRPLGNDARLALSDISDGRPHRSAVVRQRKTIEILQRQLDFVGRAIREKPQHPEISLPKVAEADQPQP